MKTLLLRIFILFSTMIFPVIVIFCVFPRPAITLEDITNPAPITPIVTAPVVTTPTVKIIPTITPRLVKKTPSKTDRLIAKFGPPPVSSWWDGSYYVIKSYIKDHARDPGSIEIISSSKVFCGTYGWSIDCSWRGRNGFGGYTTARHRFTIFNNVVIQVQEI